MEQKLLFEMTDEELFLLCPEQASGFEVGQKVKHKNAGLSAGSAGLVTSAIGEIKSLRIGGLYAWGGLCVIALVEWQDQSSFELATSALKKLGE